VKEQQVWFWHEPYFVCGLPHGDMFVVVQHRNIHGKFTSPPARSQFRKSNPAKKREKTKKNMITQNDFQPSAAI
jgi:hypothetical protein